MTEALTNAAVTDSLRALIREELEARLLDVVMLDTPEAEAAILAIVREPTRADNRVGLDMLHDWLQMRLFSDPTPPLWANVTIVYPPLPGEVVP